MNPVNMNVGSGGEVNQSSDYRLPETMDIVHKCAGDSESQGPEERPDVACVWLGLVIFDIRQNRADDLGLHEGNLEGRGPCPQADGE